jgi:predicted RNA-binding protein with RPS1 domain
MEDYHLTKVQTRVWTFVHLTEENYGALHIGKIMYFFAKNFLKGVIPLFQI